VRATGTFLHDRETLVQATTELGGGYWVLTPLRMADGSLLLINRGFVPPEARDRAARGAVDAEGESTVTGLLRITEPGGSFLQRNDPAADRWYSRDVQAIAAARGLNSVAPYFVDAEAAAVLAGAATANVPRTWPAGGLTVISFPNNHLVYAFTWFALALMVAAAAWYVGRDERRVRQGRMHEDTGHD
jgi:surfeit locus 1 family protein